MSYDYSITWWFYPRWDGGMSLRIWDISWDGREVQFEIYSWMFREQGKGGERKTILEGPSVRIRERRPVRCSFLLDLLLWPELHLTSSACPIFLQNLIQWGTLYWVCLYQGLGDSNCRQTMNQEFHVPVWKGLGKFKRVKGSGSFSYVYMCVPLHECRVCTSSCSEAAAPEAPVSRWQQLRTLGSSGKLYMCICMCMCA